MPLQLTSLMRIVLIVALILLAPSLAHADSIQLRSRATVTDTAVHLADVAALNGDDAAALADTVIARLEASQTSINLTQDAIKQQLSRAGVNWARVSLKGFETCEITRENAEKPKASKKADAPAAPANIDAPRSPIISNPTDEVGVDSQVTVRQHITQWMRNLHGEAGDAVRIEFSARDAKALDALLDGDRLVLTSTAASNLGRVPITIERFRGEKLVDTQRTTLDVARRRLAVVVVKSVTKNEIVTQEDLAVREVFVDRDNAELLTSISDATGQLAAQPLRAGAVVSRDMVRPAMLVRRSEMVTVQAIAGGFMVQTEGRALEDGGEGDVIEVRNERSRDTFTARVIGKKKVLVSDAQPKDVKSSDKPAETRPVAAKQGTRK